MAANRHYPLHRSFYAPWCPWSQRLAPVWEQATTEIYTAHTKDGLRFAKVDCTKQQPLCLRFNVQAFPSIRIFRHGSDELDPLTHQHAAYYGDRTKQALVAFAEKLLQVEPARRRRVVSEEHLSSKRDRDVVLGGWAPSAAHPGAALSPACRAISEGHDHTVLPAPAGPGCNLRGFVLIKKVPGAISFLALSEGHSIDRSSVNTTHLVNHFYYG